MFGVVVFSSRFGGVRRGAGAPGFEQGTVDERACLAGLVVAAITAVLVFLRRALPGPAWGRVEVVLAAVAAAVLFAACMLTFAHLEFRGRGGRGGRV